MGVLTAKELDTLADTLKDIKTVDNESIQQLKTVCTSLLFNGCTSTIVRKFASCNRVTRVGNALYGLMRLVTLDKNMTRGHIRQSLDLVICE